MLQVKKYKGEIRIKGSGHNTQYLDQLATDEIWIASVKMTKYLKENYNITPEEYYNLVKYGSIEPSEPCKYCGNPKHNWYKLAYGYRGDFCCHSCARSYHLTHPDEYPEVHNQFQGFNKLGIDNAGWNQGWSNTKKARSQFLSKGSLLDDCTFYLAITADGRLKIGITADSLEVRSYHNLINGVPYRSIHKVYSGSRLKVANLEALIKYKFNHSEYLDFSKLHEVILLIKELIKTNLNDYLH